MAPLLLLVRRAAWRRASSSEAAVLPSCAAVRKRIFNMLPYGRKISWWLVVRLRLISEQRMRANALDMRIAVRKRKERT